MKNPWQFRLPGFALAALLSIVLSCGLTSCEDIVTYTQPSVVRVIDASYRTPAVNVDLDGASLVRNISQGVFTQYGTFKAKSGALISIAPVAGGKSLISAKSTLLPGQQHSILISDSGMTPSTYNISLLDDQRTAAASGHSAFRFINQGFKAGAVDVYMIPIGVTLANAVPVAANLSAGSVTGYINFTSASVKIVVTDAGGTKVEYASLAIDLDGGEVRTALILDTQSTTDQPVTVSIGSDVN
jgi:hypothetical protein